jgi:MFS family permease
VIAFSCFREVNVSASGEVTEFTPATGVSLRTFVNEVCRERRFWRLALFSLLITIVRLIFRHLDATFPKYMLREFGEDAPYGMFYSINPAMIILLVPIIGALATGVHPWNMILVGSLVASASPFWLAVFPAHYWTSAMFVVTLSLGEAVYSPRVYEYTMLLSPLGREGLYTQLASAPMFVAKLFAGGMSGALLEAYCPADPPRDCQMLWLVIGCVTFAAPVLMVLLRNVIQPEGTKVPMVGDEDHHESGDHVAEPTDADVSDTRGLLVPRAEHANASAETGSLEMISLETSDGEE